jgi:ribonuclease Z
MVQNLRRMVFQIHILGSGSAMPALHRNPSAQYINILERHILIDCGEGTQLQFQKFKIKPAKIDHILISHLHGDHYLGLMGFLSSLHLMGRTKPIYIYGPTELKDIIFSQIKASKTYLNFDINFTPLEAKESIRIFEDNVMEIHTIPLKHRVYCNGFLIKEKPKPRKINKAIVQEMNVPVAMMHRLINGEDWVKDNGQVVSNRILTLDPAPARSYAYCSDTAYNVNVIPLVNEVDLLYHEATFLENLAHRAKQTFHSTAREAASIAAQANVKKLLLGHFSVRYRDVSEFESEAKEIFENCAVVNDGDCFTI